MGAPPPLSRHSLLLLLLTALISVLLSFTFPYMNSIIRPFSHRLLRPSSSSILTPLTVTSHFPYHNRTTRKMSESQQSVPPAPKALTSKAFIDAVRDRHSFYALDATSPVDDKTIVELVKDTIQNVPSSFNSQTTRLVLLVKEEHKKFWDMTYEVHKEAMSGDAQKWERSKGRFPGFQSAYGTVLFFESTAAVKKMQDASPAYAALFPGWSEHTSAMHQFVLWTALEADGFGANLQHYQFIPKVTTEAIKVFGLPEDWDLKAQLVFGGIKGDRPGAKPKLPLEETVKVFGV